MDRGARAVGHKNQKHGQNGQKCQKCPKFHISRRGGMIWQGPKQAMMPLNDLKIPFAPQKPRKGTRPLLNMHMEGIGARKDLKKLGPILGGGSAFI
ncbi:hypothetical protein O181_006031 [Austropuccinia psidii MF-1]|uniref:Uncharacterized protein n=1 Tax=Austropuccinia psidii MF-1 TaxID=1389203 RepID=A0A9Q3GGE3_9BASI|nr:hypothetical protein [Austropuccinia psidii MF-1]